MLYRVPTASFMMPSVTEGDFLSMFSTNTFPVKLCDAEGTIYAKELDKFAVLFNRKSGGAAMFFPQQDGRTMLKKWRCDTGPDITK